MKHMKRKVNIILLVLFMACVSLGFKKKPVNVFPFAETIHPNIENGYIQIVIDESSGKFTMGTIGGNPDNDKDNDKLILYGHPAPGTSWTSLRIDGTDYTFGDGGNWKITPAESSNKLIGQYTYSDIDVYQELSIVNGRSTGRADTCQILYTIKNNGSVSHTVGLRIMLDTMLGSNDGAPFYALDVGEVTKDTKWVSSMPQSIQVFDSLADPTVTGLLEFTGLGYDNPDELILGYWPQAGTWDYPFDSNKSFLDHDGDGVISGNSPDSDSAVFVYYSTAAFSAGESKTYAIRLGLGEMSVISWGPFVIGASPGDLRFSASGNDYEYLPSGFKLVAYIQNNSALPVANAVLRLKLHDNLELESGESAIKYIEDSTGSKSISPGSIAVANWAVNSFGRTIGDCFYSLTVSCADVIEDPGVLRSWIRVAGCERALFGMVTNVSGNPVSNATINASRNNIAAGTCVTSVNGTYYIGGLDPGEYEVQVVSNNYTDYSFYHTVAALADKSTSANAVLKAGPEGSLNDLNLFLYPNPVTYEQNVNVRFNTPSAGDVDVRIFNSAGRLVDEFSRSIGGAGEHYIPWNIKDCTNGIYFCQVKFGSTIESNKFAVLKYR